MCASFLFKILAQIESLGEFNSRNYSTHHKRTYALILVKGWIYINLGGVRGKLFFFINSLHF